MDISSPSPESESSSTEPTPLQRVENGERYKAKGNSAFQAGEMKIAKKEYEEALNNLGRYPLFNYYGNDEKVAAIKAAGGEVAERGKACFVTAMLNLALCCLKEEGQATHALELCETVLAEDPENAKAMYRKGKALIELDILDEAEYELTQACKLLPKDANVRQDLQKLKQRRRDIKASQKKAYGGMFEKAAGVLSEGREVESSTLAAAEAGHQGYRPIKNPKENPFMSNEDPAAEYVKLRESGKLEEAIWAMEAAIMGGGQIDAHFQNWLELGRFYMDINNDRQALGCFIEATDSDDGSNTRMHALLLKAICLLNEAKSDPEAEVTQALGKWLAVARPSAPEVTSAAELDEQLGQWRQSEGGQSGGCDAGVAHGLLHLVRGRPDDALQDFADVLGLPEDDVSFFGSSKRTATKWNMLGAVLANRTRHEHALKAYECALRLQPNYPRALFNQAIAFGAFSKPKKAVVPVAKALAIVPSRQYPAMWALMEQFAEHCDESLAEAIKERSFGKVRDILASEMAAVPTGAMPSASEVLKKMGFTASSSTKSAAS